MKPLISIVILSWNRLEDTRKCLESIAELKYPNYEVVVVDNGSSDGSKEFLSNLSSQGRLTYVDLKQNTGFTGGQINGLAASRGDFVALLNNDAVVADDWLDTLLEPMNDPQVAVVGGRAYLWNDEFSAYDDSNPFYSYQVIDIFGGYAQTLQVGDKQVSVNSISGAGILLRRTIVDAVGYFDNRFFAYFEETDLFARIKRAGFKVIYTPNAKTWHKIGQSTKEMPFFYLYYMHRNRFMYAYKNFDSEYKNQFVRQYVREGMAASMRSLVNPTLDDRARRKALLWNMFHIAGTILERRRVQKLGQTYSKLLPKDASQNVSVIIPCYNYERYVGKAIESMLNQTQPPLEILVINDGSTDGSLKAIEKYRGRVRIIDQPNSGVIKSKNRGLAEAGGDWIIFLDADDYVEPDYIEKTLSLARLHGYDVVYTDMALFGAADDYFKSHPYKQKTLREGNYIHNSALMRTALLRQIDGYKDEMSHGYEDWELYITLGEAGMKAGRIGEPLLNYRQHDDNTSRNLSAIDKASDIYKTVYTLHPNTFNRWFYFKSRISRVRTKWHVPSAKHVANYYFIDRFFITRKIKGLSKLALRGDFDSIKRKSRKHIKNFREKKIDFHND